MRKPDFSRMVSLTLAPTEAANLQAMLMAMLSIDCERPCLDDELRDTAEGSIHLLHLQLDHRKWPARNRAPFPV